MDPRYPTGRFSFNPQPTTADRRAAVEAIGAFPAELRAVLPSVRIDRPYREGGWTGRQVIHHVADSHMNAFIRFRLALTEEVPTVKPYDEAAWARLADSVTDDPSVSVRILEGLHHRWHTMLKAFGDADFTRQARHPEHGVMTLDWFLQLYAWHGRHHLGHLKLTSA